MSSIVKLLIMIMDKSKLSDRDIAKKCFVDRGTIYHIRHNKHEPRRDTAMCIINGLTGNKK